MQMSACTALVPFAFTMSTPCTRGVMITQRGVSIAKLPKTRLADAVSHVVLDLDFAITGKLNQISLVVLIWVLTRIPPNLKVSDLRCATYLDLYKSMKAACDRVRKKDEIQFNDLIDMLKAETCLSSNVVMRAAINLGFQPEWLNDIKINKGNKQDSEDSKATLQARLASPNNILTSCKHYH